MPRPPENDPELTGDDENDDEVEGRIWLINYCLLCDML